MVIVVGKSASGKNTVVEELVKKHGYKMITTYTTRPMRQNESQGNPYHFISEDEFFEMRGEGFFAEWDSFSTNEGVWYYGSAKEDYINADEKTVVILTPFGLKCVTGLMGDDIKSIYLYTCRSVLLERLKKRGDDKDEIERRMKADDADFKGIENIVSRIVYNNDGIDYAVGKILEFLDGKTS